MAAPIEKYIHTTEGENRPEGPAIGVRVVVIVGTEFIDHEGLITKQYKTDPRYWWIEFDKITRKGYKGGWFSKDQMRIL